MITEKWLSKSCRVKSQDESFQSFRYKIGVPKGKHSTYKFKHILSASTTRNHSTYYSMSRIHTINSIGHSRTFKDTLRMGWLSKSCRVPSYRCLDSELFVVPIGVKLFSKHQKIKSKKLSITLGGNMAKRFTDTEIWM